MILHTWIRTCTTYIVSKFLLSKASENLHRDRNRKSVWEREKMILHAWIRTCTTYIVSKVSLSMRSENSHRDRNRKRVCVREKKYYIWYKSNNESTVNVYMYPCMNTYMLMSTVAANPQSTRVHSGGGRAETKSLLRQPQPQCAVPHPGQRTLTGYHHSQQQQKSQSKHCF